MKSQDEMRAEATAFAMELLMPRHLIEREQLADLNDDAAIAKLAKKYRVPVGVMTVRLAEVAIRPPQTQDPTP